MIRILLLTAALSLAAQGMEFSRAMKPTRAHHTPPRPNVVVLVIDDASSSELDAMVPTPGNPLRELTNIRALADNGLRLTRFYTHAWCAPTRDSLLRGVVVGAYRGRWWCNGIPPDPRALNWDAEYTMARMFKDAGYSTAHFGKWHTAPSSDGVDWRDAPNRAGFDVVRCAFSLAPICTNGPAEVLTDGALVVTSGDLGARVRESVVGWWGSTQGPKFAHVNLRDGHEPWAFPTELLPPGYPLFPATLRTRYEAELVGADQIVGAIVAAVGPDTIVVVMSDNGTQKEVARPDQDPAKVKGTTYEEGVKSIFVIAGPGISHGSSDALVCATDILPTFAEMLQVTSPAPFEGVSLLSATRETVFSHGALGGTPETQLSTAVIGTRWKLLETNAGAEELYDLQSDPLEVAALPPTGPMAAYLRAKRIALIGH